MSKTNIKILRIYDGNRTAKEVVGEAIAYKVKKIPIQSKEVYSYILHTA